MRSMTWVGLFSNSVYHVCSGRQEFNHQPTLFLAPYIHGAPIIYNDMAARSQHAKVLL